MTRSPILNLIKKLCINSHQGLQACMLLRWLGHEARKSGREDGYRRHRSFHVYSPHLYFCENER